MNFFIVVTIVILAEILAVKCTLKLQSTLQRANINYKFLILLAIILTFSLTFGFSQILLELVTAIFNYNKAFKGI